MQPPATRKATSQPLLLSSIAFQQLKLPTGSVGTLKLFHTVLSQKSSQLTSRWQEQYHGELMRQMAEVLLRADQKYA